MKDLCNMQAVALQRVLGQSQVMSSLFDHPRDTNPFNNKIPKQLFMLHPVP
jgi:hypothetical protein